MVACLCIENGAINSWFLCSAPKLLSNNVLHIMGMIIIMVIIIMIIIAITVRLMRKVGSFQSHTVMSEEREREEYGNACININASIFELSLIRRRLNERGE